MLHHDFIRRIQERSAIVGVIGLGYVGLPLALTFATREFSVIGFDVDPKKIESLRAGESYINHIPNETISTHVGKGSVEATTDYAKLKDVDAILVCVPTPLNNEREPDLSYVVSTIDMIMPNLKQGHLVVLESTTYPGCTESVVKPLLNRSGLKSGQDYYLAYSPEREDPGNPEFATARIPKVVGGDGATALEIATALYDEIVVETVPVSSMDVAEAVKLTENIFRSVNIALVNELKTIFAKMGVDIWEVIEAAKTKPFGYMPFYPGPGLGGHCIPIDPFYLTWRAKQVGEETRFIELAGEINTSMPERVVDILDQTLSDLLQKSLSGSKILLVGLAYKKNVDDTRESPAFALIELMELKGASVDFYDPYIPEIPVTREHTSLAGRVSVDCTAETLEGYDAVLICTDHENIDYDLVARHANMLIDTRGVVRKMGLANPRLVQA